MRKGLAGWLLVAFLLSVLGATIWLGYVGWTMDGDVQVSKHGYIALALGVFFSLAVGVGLMALVFYSSRAGYDEPPVYIDGDDRARSSLTDRPTCCQDGSQKK